MYPLMETIRMYSRSDNLKYHEMRRYKAIKELFNTTPKKSLHDILSDCPFDHNTLFKVTVEYDADNYEVTVYSYNPKLIKTLRMVESNVQYNYKWTNREALTGLLSDDVHEDVIIVKNGWITDASYANLVFKKDGKWYTPQHCLLQGTMRHCLLDEGIIHEMPIRCDDIGQFSHVKLINAMLRFNFRPLPISKIIPLP